MSTFAPPEQIGFIGLGKMGNPMTRNLAKAGFKLALYDVDPKITASLAAEFGATACASIAEVARSCRVVITMVPDGKIVREIALGKPGGDGGLAAALAKSSLVIDMSSSAPVGTRELGAELAAHGIRMIDAPVSGGVRRAVDGSLAIMLGGDTADIESARKIVEAMGKQIFVAGALGAGHAIKCLNNYVSAAGLLAAAEGLMAAQRFGLDPKVALEVMNASTGKNNSTENKFAQFVFSRSFGSGFGLPLMAKDLRTALDLAAHVGAPMPLGEHCVPIWNEAEKALGGASDHTEIVRVLEKMIGVELGKPAGRAS